MTRSVEVTGVRAVSVPVDDADATHASMTAAGFEVDEVLRWPGVPAVFGFRDPDGDALSITETG